MRGPWLWIVLLAAFLVGAWVLWGGDAPHGPEPDSADELAASDTEPLLTGRPSARSPVERSLPSEVPAAPDARDAHATTDAPDDASTGSESVPVGAVAVVRVLLDLPEPWLQYGTVYAHPPDAAGAEDETERVPAVDVKKKREVQLALPAAGRWDVGYVCHLGSVLVRNVDVDDGPIRLACRDAAPIRIKSHVAGTARVRIRTPGDSAVSRPGHTQRAPVGVNLSVEAGGVATTPPLPPGLDFDVFVYGVPRLRGEEPGIDWRARPHTARAGDEVVIEEAPLGVVAIDITLAGSAPPSWFTAMKTNVWVAARASGPALRKDRFASTWLTKEGLLQKDRLLMPLPPGAYTIKFGIGKAFHEQVFDVAVAAGRTHRLEGTLQPNPRYAPHGLAPTLQTRAWLRFAGASKGEVRVFAHERDDEGDAHFGSHSMRLGSEERHEISTGGRIEHAHAFRFPDRASDRFLVPKRGEVNVRLQPAGMLMLVPEREPHESLGTLRVRRADGRPLVWTRKGTSLQDDGAGLEMAWEVTAEAGRLLGPLRAGTHRFEVFLGPVRIGTAEAEVVAGVLRPLSIRIPKANVPK